MRYIFIILAAIFLSSCAEMGQMQSVLEDAEFKPKIAINDVRIKSIDLSNLTLKANISISNLLPLDVYIKDAMVNIYYEDKIINSYKIKGQNLLKARSKNDINLDSSLRLNDLAKLIKDYASLDSIPLKLEVNTDIFLPNFTKENIMQYNLRERFDIDIPTINPSISLKNIDFSLSNIKAIFNLKNQAKANLNLDSINYALIINGVEFSGIAKSVKRDDNSIDIILDNLANSLKLNNSKNISLNLNTTMKLDKTPYEIPLNINKIF